MILIIQIIIIIIITIIIVIVIVLILIMIIIIIIIILCLAVLTAVSFGGPDDRLCAAPWRPDCHPNPKTFRKSMFLIYFS